MTDAENDRELAEVLGRVRKGEVPPFEAVVRRFERPLRAWLAAQAPPGVDSDELTQLTFVAAFTRLNEFEVGTNFGAWLFTIARYQLRTETTRLRRVADYQARYAPDLLQRELERRDTRPPELWEARLESLRACLDALSDPLRRFITWRYEEEIPLEEISVRCGRSVAAVKKQLWTLRQGLHDCVERRLAAAGGRS